MNPHAEDWASQGYLPIWIIARKIGKDISPREAVLELTAQYIKGGQVRGKTYSRGIAFTYCSEIDPFSMLHEIAHAKLEHNSKGNPERWFREEIEAIVWSFSKHGSCKQFETELYLQIRRSMIDCNINRDKAFRIATSALLAKIDGVKTLEK